MANADTWPREISVLKASTAHLVKTCVTWLQFHVIRSLIFSPPHGNISVGDDLPFMIFVYSFSVRLKACMMMFNSQRVVKEYLSGHATSYTATYTIFSIAQTERCRYLEGQDYSDVICLFNMFSHPLELVTTSGSQRFRCPLDLNMRFIGIQSSRILFSVNIRRAS
ncbi:uncharacterized protein ARMOST_15366 [Armillaria ostoyae]|uniref:Uncharacterized protein n=1 Tax=Armillaria ostoyae TaxID=47428 RepID=A0A284RT80_ARMOS|nr:uncharacterized protein ARMOST_15366 [Armillaria ostoyae]